MLKKLEVPFWIGDILEFKIKNTTVRGEITYVTFSKDEATATVYDIDTYTKRCSECSSKCEFYKDNDCEFFKHFPLEAEEIKSNEIGVKYKIVKKSWKPEETENK